MVTALERQHMLPPRALAHELQRVLDRLRAANVELHPPLHAEAALDALADHLGELDLFTMEILAGELRQPLHLIAQRLHHLPICVAEVDSGIPHLQIKVLPPVEIVEKAAFAALEDLRLLGVVDSVAVRAITALFFEQHEFLFVDRGGLRFDM